MKHILANDKTILIKLKLMTSFYQAPPPGQTQNPNCTLERKGREEKKEWRKTVNVSPVSMERQEEECIDQKGNEGEEEKSGAG